MLPKSRSEEVAEYQIAHKEKHAYCTFEKGSREITVKQSGPWFVDLEINLPVGRFGDKTRRVNLTLAQAEAIDLADCIKAIAENLIRDTGDYKFESSKIFDDNGVMEGIKELGEVREKRKLSVPL